MLTQDNITELAGYFHLLDFGDADVQADAAARATALLHANGVDWNCLVNVLRKARAEQHDVAPSRRHVPRHGVEWHRVGLPADAPAYEAFFPDGSRTRVSMRDDNNGQGSYWVAQVIGCPIERDGEMYHWVANVMTDGVLHYSSAEVAQACALRSHAELC